MPLPPFSNEMLLKYYGRFHPCTCFYCSFSNVMTFYNCMLASLELEVTITKFHFCTAKCIAGAVFFVFFNYKNYTATVTNFGVVIEKHLD